MGDNSGDRPECHVRRHPQLPANDLLIELSWEGERPDVTTFEGDVDPSAM